MTSSASYRPGHRILEFARTAPDRPALIVDGESWTYAELIAAAAHIAAEFPAACPGEPQPITAVMAQRHISAYAGILAARLCGHAYVPLNANHPSQRNATILAASGAARVICGALATDQFEGIRQAAPQLRDSITPVRCGDQKSDYSLHRTGWPIEFLPGRGCQLSDLAYILFTSGSTGNPKGVPIGHSQLESYLRAAGPMIGPRPDDRFSQTFDLTFDVSVHDMFVCWENGATLVVPSQHELRKPADFIRAHGITCWFSVPSLAYQMRLQNELRPGAFPRLRSSLFAGEALPSSLAYEWAAAAPNSRVENWYGPTEATIVVSRYVLGGEPIDEDTVPIGQAFPAMELLVLDEKLGPCPVGVPGGLYLAGAQVAAGYLNDPQRTAESFISLPGSNKVVYKTGDRALLGVDGNVRYLGRMDNQVKVRGYRIELGEIEAALRTATDGMNVVALAWPPAPAAHTAIVAAVETGAADLAAIQQHLRGVLPSYMVPSTIFLVGEFPKNASGKVDRKALAAELARRGTAENLPAAQPLADDEETLLSAILSQAPQLDRCAIRAAGNLFEAGIDSLAFTGLTVELERRFGVSLDQEQVVRLSALSFDEILRELGGTSSVRVTTVSRPRRTSVLSWLKARVRGSRGIPKARANRAVQFIERFPGYLAEHGAPDVLAFGSSCTLRDFSPAEFAAAAAGGKQVHALNAGFPAVHLSGLRKLCEFVRDQCLAAHVRIPLVIYELDVMQVSTTPPAGEIDLGPEYFSGRIRSSSGNTNREFEWDVATAGDWNCHVTDACVQVRQPEWLRARDRVVAAAYVGQIEFVREAVDDWYAGARALQKVCDRMFGFVPPADQALTGQIESSRGGTDNLSRFTAEAEARLGIAFLPWRAFELTPADFLDINHLNAHGGRAKFSRQLAHLLFAQSHRAAG
jgi:amino acid adenylation domain-containing protein